MDLPSVSLPFSIEGGQLYAIEGGQLYAQTRTWRDSAAFTDVSTPSHELWRTHLPAKVLSSAILTMP
jgi:hypothetical protein